MPIGTKTYVNAANIVWMNSAILGSINWTLQPSSQGNNPKRLVPIP